MFTLRFDLRAPSFGAPAPDLYAAVPEMCAWAETRGALLAVLSEHHATEDGHLPSPLLMAAAVAARTERLAILLAAVVLPLYDPVRLAEDMAVLDNLSRGRVAYVFGVGHRREDYEHVGLPYRSRGRVADENLDLVRELLRGEPVVHEGRRVHVTPAPSTPGGPPVMIAGGSPAAVRRAARRGLGFIAQTNPPGLKELFESESRAHGFEPAGSQFPEKQQPTAVFVTEDVDRAWAELGPHLLHDARMAARYRKGDTSIASISRATTVEELRADPSVYAVLTVEEATARIRAGQALGLHPLCGGLAPDVAWGYLEHAAEAERHALKEENA